MSSCRFGMVCVPSLCEDWYHTLISVILQAVFGVGCTFSFHLQCWNASEASPTTRAQLPKLDLKVGAGLCREEPDGGDVVVEDPYAALFVPHSVHQESAALKKRARPSSMSNSSAMSNDRGFLRSIIEVDRVRMVRRVPLLVARATEGKYVGISGEIALPTATGNPLVWPSRSMYLT